MKKKTVGEFWQEIFDKYDILNKINNEDFFTISADQIKEFKEPRLMTKFDDKKSRPEIFRENKLGILPIDNGQYVIGKFDLYKTLPNDDVEPVEMIFPEYLESIDPDNIYSESNALNIALLSGMIEGLIGEDLFETISGRMRVDSFSFKVNSKEKQVDINVKKPQVEIDGGYESKNKLVLIEAKRTDPDDFIIRQLYYPYRFWKTKIKKEIVPIFFNYKNGIYNFYVYKFEDEMNYNSIQLINHISYSLKYLNPFRLMLESIEIIEESSSIPFPQADNFTKIKGIIDFISDEGCTSEDIAELYEFTSRQGNYYLSAARYLGLIYKIHNRYYLTELSLDINKLSVREKNAKLAEKILSHKTFSETYKFYQNYNKMPSKTEIKDIMYKYEINVPSNNDSVYNRRASTLRGWIQWIVYSDVEID